MDDLLQPLIAMTAGAPLPLPLALCIARSVCTGLRQLHTCGMAMLCLKPGNVLLSSLPDLRHPADPTSSPPPTVVAALSDFGLNAAILGAGLIAPRVLKPVFNYT